MKGILNYKDKISKCRCLIIGDSMIDEYISGKVERISPEAPVPIVCISDVKYTLGGAANVAANIRKLGANCVLIGVVGKDSDSFLFFERLEKLKIQWAGLISEDRMTTKKTRIIGNWNQLVRLDKELNINLREQEEVALLEHIKCEIIKTDIIVISDYMKGVCTEKICKITIQLAKEYKKIVIVDPKQLNWERYKGAYLIKPNLKEFYSVTRNENINIVTIAKKLLQQYCFENILLTRSQEGMMLIGKQDVINYVTEAREVFDVSGAGDTVIATLATLMGAGMNLLQAIEFANIAAGIAVGKLGTYAVSLNEIVLAKSCFYSKKIMTKKKIKEVVSSYKLNGKKIVFTNGCFDILHIGHITLLERAKELGDILIVGLNSDTSVKRLKGDSRPINNEYDRAKVLASLEVVDVVVVFEEDTPIELISAIIPNVLVKGADYAIDNVVGAEIVQKNGGKVVLVPIVQEKSTTQIISRCNITSD